MKNFVNMYNEEVTKKQYVDEKIRILDEFLIFSQKSILGKEKAEDRKYWVRRILMSQNSDIQIDSLCRVLTVQGMPIDIFIKRYSKEYLEV